MEPLEAILVTCTVVNPLMIYVGPLISPHMGNGGLPAHVLPSYSLYIL